MERLLKAIGAGLVFGLVLMFSREDVGVGLWIGLVLVVLNQT